MDILSKIDYSILKATTTDEEVLRAAEETKKYGFATLCVFPKHIRTARIVLPEEKVCSVVAFPLSTVPTQLKVAEAIFSAEEGAGELDVVVDVGAVKAWNWKKVEDELLEIRNNLPNKVLKLIMECCYLTEEEKLTLCKLAIETGWDLVKTSTGYAPYGAQASDVELLVKCSEGKIKVKAAGGIRDLPTAEKFIEIGAERIGTSSAVEIAKEVLYGREV